MILIPYERYKALLNETDGKEHENENEAEDKNEDCENQKGSGFEKAEKSTEKHDHETEADIIPPPPGLPANASFLSMDKEQTQDSDNWLDKWIPLNHNDKAVK